MAAELVAASPEVLGSRRVGDSDVDTQHPWAAALSTSGYNISDIGTGLADGTGILAGQSFQLEPVTLAGKVVEEVIR